MNTHNFRPLITALTLTLCLTACLDEHPKDQASEDAVYTSASEVYTNAVASLYNYFGSHTECEGLQGTCRGIYDYNTLTTDEAIMPIRGGDWYDGGLWKNMYDHTWTATDTDLYNVWKYLFRTIVLANNSLDAISAHANLLTDKQRAAYEAEVRAVRALFYWYAMDMFGSIPLVTQDSRHAEGITQSSRSAVYRFIVDELQAVRPYLSTANSVHPGEYYGHITTAAVDFMLAKLTLNAEVYSDDDWTDGRRPNGSEILFTVDGRQLNAWQACAAFCQRITDAGYLLEEDYTANFAVHNEGSLENIFTIPLDKMLYPNEFHYLFRSRHYAHGGAYGGSSENGTCATVSTARAYGYGTDDEDPRFDLNFYAGKVFVDDAPVMLDDGTQLEYQPLAVEENLTASPYKQTAGARMKKYEVDRSAYSDGRMPDNDIVLFRYADVLLMQAEALTRGGGDGSAYLDAVRKRAGVPSVACTLDNILRERLLELVWEGWRRQDLVRFSRYTSAYDMRTPLEGESSGYTTVFPIPKTCIDLNPLLKQNPGY